MQGTEASVAAALAVHAARGLHVERPEPGRDQIRTAAPTRPRSKNSSTKVANRSRARHTQKGSKAKDAQAPERDALLAPPGFEIASHYEAARELNEVGGDFYDAFTTAGGWMLAIGERVPHSLRRGDELSQADEFALYTTSSSTTRRPTRSAAATSPAADARPTTGARGR
jgi:hypothetical protein